MSDFMNKKDSVQLLNELLNDIEEIDFLVDSVTSIERSEMEFVIKDQLFRLHQTLDEIEKVMDHNSSKGVNKGPIHYTTSIYST